MQSEDQATRGPAAGAEPSREFTPGHLRLLAGCVLGLALNVGVVFNGTLSAFMKPMIAETGWSRGAVSAGLAAAMAAQLLCLPVAGRLADRYGGRRVILLGAPLFSLAVMSLGLIPPGFGYYLACCVLVGMTGSLTYAPVFNSLLPPLFRRRLGLAVGIVSAGSGLGLIVAPALAQRLILVLGWRGAYIALGVIVLALLAPIAAVLLRQPNLAVAREAQAWVDTKPRRFRFSLKFIRIALTYFLTGLAISGLMVHLVPMLTDRGVTPGSAVLLMSCLGLASLIARLFSGLALDYVDSGLLGAFGFVLAATGMMLLAWNSSFTAAFVAVILVGAALGTEGDVLPYVTRKVFGGADYGSLLGAMSSAFLGGVLIGPLVAGYLFDVTGGYAGALFVFAACSLTAAAVHGPVTLRLKPSP